MENAERKTSSTFNLNEYADRVCSEICGYHKLFRHLVFPDDVGGQQKWGFLAEKKCMNDCPLEQMMQLLGEERDQHMELELEVEWV